MDKDGSIFVAGHRGLAGSAICRRLRSDGFSNLILRNRHELDLRNQASVDLFFQEYRPEYVFLAAATVGGILANSERPADFIRDNLFIQGNIIDSAYRHGARKLLFLGSSCIYPRLAEQPLKEEYLLTGPLESTNEWYAVAKIAGIKMVQAYRAQYGFPAISLMPTNLYGPGDNFDLRSSHVLPALIRKFHEAKLSGASEVIVWGTGSPRREFLHVDDLADAAVFLMRSYDEADIINVGAGKDLPIRELAQIVRQIAGYSGEIVFDVSRPDGAPGKCLDISRLSARGWTARIPLRQGIESTYRWYVDSRGG